MRLIPHLPAWGEALWWLCAAALALFIVLAVGTACTPLVCAQRVRVERVGDDVAVKCGTSWTRQYRCVTAGVVVRGGEARLLCDGSTLAVMPGDVTEVRQ